MATPKVRNRFQTVRLPIETPYKEGEEPLVKQAFKDECDINKIINKFQKTGIITHAKEYGGQYAEVDPITFHEAMNTVAQTQQMFDELPSSLRSRFGHDPGAFLDFVQDENNLEEMAKLGLLNETGARRLEELRSISEQSGASNEAPAEAVEPTP